MIGRVNDVVKTKEVFGKSFSGTVLIELHSGMRDLALKSLETEKHNVSSSPS
jgi:hypothetical protein